MKTGLVQLLAILLLHGTVASSPPPIVNTENGLLKGKRTETTNGRAILSFTGIPYARPPLGELRLQPPVPVDNWEGIKDATKEHDMCIQINKIFNEVVLNGDEDCLFLNVYTPEINKTDLPVMVYIHGGGFYYGSGNKGFTGGPDTLLRKDVVLVTINYRLGALGFFTTGDQVVPGNNGMKDQNLALKWVNKNIKNFGGDAKSVTIFGESAGASSTHLHMLSPLSKGLFHAAISQSGSALATWSLDTLQRGVDLSKRLAILLNCPMELNSEMVKCLHNVAAEEFIWKTATFLEWDVEPTILFKPVIERSHPGAFISDTPQHITKNGLGSDVPWIVGMTSAEGAMRSGHILSSPSLLNEFNEKFPDIGHVVLFMDKTNNTVAAFKKLLTYYFGKSKVGAANGKSLTDLYSDAYSTVNINNAVSLHKKYNKQPVYLYLFDYRGSVSYSTIFGGGDTDFGVCHCDDLLYLFPMIPLLFPDKQPTETDLQMEKLLTTLWTNFAAKKNPTPSCFPTEWKPVKSANNEYLHIKQDQSLCMEKNMFKERRAFWKTLEPLLKVY